MKFIKFALTNALFTPGLVAAQSIRGQGLRKTTEEETACTPLQKPCTIFMSDTLFQDGHSLETMECKLHREDTGDLGFVNIDGLGLDVDTTLDKNGNSIVLGKTTVFAEGMELCGSSVQVPPGSEMELTTENRNNRDLTAIPYPVEGTRKVLVVRVQALDSQLPLMLTELEASDTVFGIIGDIANLRKQMNRCSYGKLKFEPFTRTTPDFMSWIGVISLSLSRNIVGQGIDTVDGWVLDEMRNIGILDSNDEPMHGIDHIMFAYPHGTEKNGDKTWIGYGKFNSWYTRYNADSNNANKHWLQSSSLQMHEIGHNFNLRHANEGTETYGDKSGTMGYSYSVDDKFQCFNGANSWELGWYEDKQTTFDPDQDSDWDSTCLMGVSDYGFDFSSLGLGNLECSVVVKIPGESNNFFVAYNRASGINANTSEGADKVLVTKVEQGPGKKSYLEAKLNEGEYFTIPGSEFGAGSPGVTVRVTSIYSTLRFLPELVDISVKVGN